MKSRLEIELSSLGFGDVTLRTPNGEVVTHNLKEELKINEYDLNTEFHNQSSKYVYWTSLLETVRAYLESAQLLSERTRAALYEPCRQDLISGGVAKPTKDQIDSEIMKNAEYISTVTQVNNYTYYVKNLQYAVKAFEQRKDMLIQLGAEQRRQRDYEIALKGL